MICWSVNITLWEISPWPSGPASLSRESLARYSFNWCLKLTFSGFGGVAVFMSKGGKCLPTLSVVSSCFFSEVWNDCSSRCTTSCYWMAEARCQVTLTARCLDSMWLLKHQDIIPYTPYLETAADIHFINKTDLWNDIPQHACLWNDHLCRLHEVHKLTSPTFIEHLYIGLDPTYPRHSMHAIYAYIGGGLGGQCRHIWHAWSVWD